MPAIASDEFEVGFRIGSHSVCAHGQISRTARQRALGARFRLVESSDLSGLSTSSIDNRSNQLERLFTRQLNVQTCKDYTRDGPEKIGIVGGLLPLECNPSLAT